jgi:hypothetical protein
MRKLKGCCLSAWNIGSNSVKHLAQGMNTRYQVALVCSWKTRRDVRSPLVWVPLELLTPKNLQENHYQHSK